MNKNFWDKFFEARSVDDCTEILKPRVNNPSKATLSRLIKIVRNSDPKISELKEMLKKKLKEDDNEGWGWLGLSSVAYIQRQAAIRFLGNHIDKEGVFKILWELAQCKHTNIGNLQYEALRVLIITVPCNTYSMFYLEQYRRPYPKRKDPNRKTAYDDISPRTAAGTLLIAGFAYCDRELQEEIKKTVKFAYFKNPEELKEKPYKYSDNSDCGVRHRICELLHSIFLDKNMKLRDTEEFKKMFHDNFLDKFLKIFTDDAGFYYCELSIALNWIGEEKVINAFCDYLEKWGGTFLNEDSTKSMIYGLTKPEALVTPRLVAAMKTVYDKPMDADFIGDRPPMSHIGSYSANEIRKAIEAWRNKKLKPLH